MASCCDNREQMQKEKDPSDVLRGGREKRERTAAQRKRIIKLKEVPELNTA